MYIIYPDAYICSMGERNNRRIVVAPDKFKGSMTASTVAEAVRDGLLEGAAQSAGTAPEILLRPMADGGEGSMGVMERILRDKKSDYSKVFIDSVNHLGSQSLVPVLMYTGKEGTPAAFIEMASVCGLNMIPREKRNLLRSSTYGLGMVIRSVIEEYGVRKILLAIGGSGTNDGGFGMLTALGWSFTNSNPFRNKDIPTFISGIESVSDRSVPDICPHLRDTVIEVATDVTSPLLGASGATAVYGPQKGCRRQDMPVFEKAMENWVNVIGAPDFPGAGAAGGTGYALKAVLGATLKPGWKLLADMSGLEDDIASASLVITGEGRFDASSLTGKLPAGIATLCRRYGKPLWVVTGLCRVPAEQLPMLGITRVIELSSSAASGEDPFADAPAIIRHTVAGSFLLDPVTVEMGSRVENEAEQGNEA